MRPRKCPRKCRQCRGKGTVLVFDSDESERNAMLNVTMLATIHWMPYKVGYMTVTCPKCGGTGHGQ